MTRPTDKTPIGDKVRHVRNARQTRDHECHWPDCTEQVKPAAWGCLKHWRMLPKDLQREIWDAYRPGQEADQRPSRRYLDVAHKVQLWIEAHRDLKPSNKIPSDDPKAEVGSFARGEQPMLCCARFSWGDGTHDLTCPTNKPTKPAGAWSRSSNTEIQSRLYQLALHYADRVSTVIPWQKLVTDEFAERAAIREHVGGIPREKAEWAALQDLVEYFNLLVSDPARRAALP